MSEITSAPTSQAAKAGECSVFALLEDIKAAGCTCEASKELCHRLSSIEKALGSFAAELEQPASCKLSTEVQHHLRMAILSNQDACARYQNAFKEWASHSNNNSLHESDWNGFDAFQDIELRLLSERLQVLKNTIDMAMEISCCTLFFNPPSLNQMAH